MHDTLHNITLQPGINEFYKYASSDAFHSAALNLITYVRFLHNALCVDLFLNLCYSSQLRSTETNMCIVEEV